MTAVPPRPAAGEVCRCGHPLANHWQTGKRLCMACPDGECPDFTPRPAAPDASPVDTLQERIADVLTGWQIGYGFYALNVDAGTAREMAVAVLSEMRQGTR